MVEMGRMIGWAGASRKGLRKVCNEDAWVGFTAGVEGSQLLEECGEVGLERCDVIFAVSDGMGGCNAGELASALIVSKLSAMIPATFRAAASGLFPDSMAYLADVVRQVHEEINGAAAGVEERRGMGATLALCWFTPENVYLANVGDSRVYLFRDGMLEQVSRDHTSAWVSWKRGEMKEVEYRCHPRRAALYATMGGGSPEVFPYLEAIPYRAGDRFLICSDGVVDGLWEDRIGRVLGKGEGVEGMCAELLERALEGAGADDTTLVVIEIR